MKSAKITRAAFTFLILTSLPACSTYRVVKVGTGVDERNIVTPFYGMARRNILIPEYTVDDFGNYPGTAVEAQRRFDARKDAVEPVVAAKYDLSGGGMSSLPRNALGVGLCLVSPLVIPVQYLGEAFSVQDKKRSFGKIVSDYFNAGFYPAIPERPKIRERIDLQY